MTSLNKTYLALILFTSVFFLVSCDKDDDSVHYRDTYTQTFSFERDGVPVTSDSTDGMAMLIDSMAGSFNRQLAIGCYTDNQMLMIGGLDLESSDDFTGMMFPSANSGTAFLELGTIDSMMVGVMEYEQASANIQITRCDPASRKVDGFFSGELVSLFTGDTVKITNGRFKNIPYEVQ